MTLGWDILFDGVSIKEKVQSFNLIKAKNAYANELSLFIADADFYDSINIVSPPFLRIEVKTIVDAIWTSQGFFYIEEPISRLNKDGSTSPGIWGRSSTAILGAPFAVKVSKGWDTDTTTDDIINEMAALCGITVISELDNYPIFANSYIVSSLYPIGVIDQIVKYIGGYVTCDSSGQLVIKKVLFHPTVADYSLSDDDNIELNETVDFPTFGNRIKISATGTGAGMGVNLYSIGVNCLPNDTTTSATLLAFVTDTEGEIAADGTIVDWSVTSESLATLENQSSNVGTYFFEHHIYQANSYNVIELEFPIYAITGIWAYADRAKTTNLWNSATDSFSGNTITLDEALEFCDQTLVISYTTYGCAINRVTSGSNDVDIVITADVSGATDSITIKQGTGCDCGGGDITEDPDVISNGGWGEDDAGSGNGLSIRINPTSGVCFGNNAIILVSAVKNGAAAIGEMVILSIFSGCGTLSSTNKVLGIKLITNETGTISNNISNVSQCSTDISIDSATLVPTVYQFTVDEDGIKTRTGSDLYSSHYGKTIDLTTILPTGTDVLIDYYARGVAFASWQTAGITEECNVVIVATMADGSEAGLRVTTSTGTVDCSIPDNDIPDIPPGDSEDDPTTWDSGDGGSGGFPSDGDDEGSTGIGGDSGIILSVCDIAILNRISNSTDSRTSDENRFQTDEECSDDPEDSCSCSELCASEIRETGSSYDNPGETIAQTVEGVGNEAGTPEYEEAFETERASQQSTCESNCESAREEACGDCEPTTEPTSLVLTPGDSMEVTCSDGTTDMITMPEGACGTVSFTVGCCTFEVRSTVGHWVLVSSEVGEQPNDGCAGTGGGCSYSDVIENPSAAGTRASGSINCFVPPYPYGTPGCGSGVNDCTMASGVGGGGNCTTDCTSNDCFTGVAVPWSYTLEKWECEE